MHWYSIDSSHFEPLIQQYIGEGSLLFVRAGQGEYFSGTAGFCLRY